MDQDPGQAGKAQVNHYARLLAGYTFRPNPVRESKGRRANPLSAQAEQGNVLILRGEWNDGFLTEAENFDGTDRGHADRMDATSGAYHVLTEDSVAEAPPQEIIRASYFRGL